MSLRSLFGEWFKEWERLKKNAINFLADPECRIDSADDEERFESEARFYFPTLYTIRYVREKLKSAYKDAVQTIDDDNEDAFVEGFPLSIFALWETFPRIAAMKIAISSILRS